MQYITNENILKNYRRVETGNGDDLYLDPRVGDFIRRVLSPYAKDFDEYPDYVNGTIERDFEDNLGKYALYEYTHYGIEGLMDYLVSELLDQGILAKRDGGVHDIVPLIREDVILGILSDEGLNKTFNVYSVINEEDIKQEYLVSLARISGEGEIRSIFSDEKVTIANEEALAGLHAAMICLRDKFIFLVYTQNNGENKYMLVSTPKIIDNPRYLVQDIPDQLEILDGVYIVKVGERYYKFNTPYFMQGVFTASNWTGVPHAEIYSDLRRINDGSEVIME